MEFRLVTTQQPDDWLEALELQPHSDVYYLPEYHRAYELNGDGLAQALCAKRGDDHFFYPFLLRSIDRVGDVLVNNSWCDIETVYGYSGPLSTTADPAFLREVWELVHEWCHHKNAIAEFIRFDPLLDNSTFVDQSYRVKLDRETVVMKLDCSEDELWNNYPGGQRAKIKKAIAGGLRCEELSLPEGLTAFADIYEKTMDRVGAADYYYFSRTYLDRLATGLGKRLRLFAVYDNARILAAALFFTFDNVIHYHLGGSEAAARELRPNNLLFHGVAQWGREHGYRWLHLGGGRTSLSDDSLLRFKGTFSTLRRSFYTGRKVHNPAVYESLCSQWLKQANRATRPDYFLLYRMGIQP